VRGGAVTSAEIAERSGRARARVLVSAIPAWGWVAGLVCLSAGIRFAIAQHYPGPWIFHDEVAYSDLGRSLGRTGSFAIRDVPGDNGFGIVYSAVISPAYAIFGQVPTAYRVARGINALVMSLTAVPAYLLARQLVRPPLAFLAAVLAVAIPAMTYTTSMMTENAFYPTFVLVVLTMYVGLERPTLLRQLLVFPAILVAFYTRVQAIVFVPALVTAVVILSVLDAWLEPGGRFLTRLRRSLASYWLIWALSLGGSALVVLYEHARGRSFSTLLGSYGGVASFTYRVGPIARWFVYHLGEIDFAVGILPFAAFLYVVTGLLLVDRRRPLRVFAAISVPIVLWFCLAVAAYASNPVGNRIEERNFFFVDVLFFTALVVWVEHGLPRRSFAALAAVLVAMALPVVLPYTRLIDANSVSGAFGLLPLMHLEHWRVSVAPGHLRFVALAGAVVAGIFLLALPRRFAVAAPFAVLAYLALATEPAHMFTEQASRASAHAGISVKRNWIDRAVGEDENVAILYYATDAVPYWQNEFFNASVNSVYNINGRYDGLPQTQVGVKPKTQLLVQASGRFVHAHYLLVNQTIFPRGRMVAEDPLTGIRLYRTAGRYVRISQLISGIYPDTWSGPNLGYQRFGCVGGTLIVTLTSDPQIHPDNQLVTASEGGREVARRVIKPVHDVGRRMVVPLRSTGGDCGVDFTITPTAVPNDALKNGDLRQLGIRFTGFVYRPPR
jgi:Dolichyl-phosphate-mannose-protein mannosyltransferase